MRITPFALAITLLSLAPILRGETLGPIQIANDLPPGWVVVRMQGVTSFINLVVDTPSGLHYKLRLTR